MAEVVVDTNDIQPGSSVEKQFKDTSGDSPADKPADKPADAPPADSPVDKPADKPADAPPADKSADAPVFDKEKYASELLKDIFGDNVDRESAKKLVSELPKLTEKVTEYEKNRITFANDYVKGLNDYLAKGGNKETYEKVQALDLSKLEGLELIKAQYKWDHPELTEDQIARKLNKKYSQTDDFDADEKELGLVDIAIDSKEAKSKLEAIKQKESVPDAERQRIVNEEAEQKRVAAWKPQIKAMVDAANGVDLVLATDEKGNPTKTFQYKISDPKLKESLQEDIQNILQAWDVQPNADTIKDLSQIVNERILVRDHNNIVKAIWNEANTTIDKQYRDKYHLGDAPPAGDAPPVKRATDNSDELYDKQVKRERGW